MKIKFNKFERVAGLFVGGALLGSLAVSAAVAVKKGWFVSKVPYQTVMTSAEGIHAGTAVQIAGLRAGAVDEVDLVAADRVLVRFEIFEKFKSQIRQGSSIQVLRPFIIGEKVLEISVGDASAPMLASNDEIPIKSAFDIMDLMSGKKLGPVLGTLEKLSENLRVLGEAFADPQRTQALVKMFDRMTPLVSNLNTMAEEVVKITTVANRQKRLDTIVGNVVTLTNDLNKVLPGLVEDAPDVGQQMAQIVKNLNVLTSEFQKLTPAIAAIAPELPKTSLRAVEALNETVVLLKALQKSFLLKGKVEEVRDEERAPASTSKGSDK